MPSSDIALLQSARKILLDIQKSLPASPIEVHQIKSLGDSFKQLGWNLKDPTLIRNCFGKINYAKSGSKNVDYIDFVRFSYLSTLADSDDFGQDVMLMLSKNKQALNGLLQSVDTLIKAIESGSQPRINRDSFSPLLQLIDFFYDRIIVNKMQQVLSDAKLLANEPYDGDKKLFVRYSAARIITILGEAAKTFSERFTAKFPGFYSRELAKLRDLLAHQHRKYVRDADETLMGAYSQFLYHELPVLAGYLQKVSTDLDQVFDRYKNSAEKEKIIAGYVCAPQKVKVKLVNRQAGDQFKKKQKIKKQLLDAKKQFDALTEKSKKGEALTEGEKRKCQYYPQTKRKLEKSLAKVLAGIERSSAKGTVADISLSDNSGASSSVDSQSATEPVSGIVSLYACLKKFDKSFAKPKKRNARINSDREKLLGLMKAVTVEHEVLRSFRLEPNMLSKRSYATEYVVSVIGQLFRDLHEKNAMMHGMVGDISNSFVNNHMQKTIGVRNAAIVHAPFDVDPQLINEHIEGSILTTVRDHEALANLTQASLGREVDKYLLDRAGRLNNYAADYQRLGWHDLALMFIKQAIEFLKPSALSKAVFDDYGISQKHGKVYVFLDDKTHFKRYQAYSNAGNIMLAVYHVESLTETREPRAEAPNRIESSSYRKAYDYFKEAYFIYKQNPDIVNQEEFDAGAILVYIKLALKFQPEQYSRQSFSSELTLLEKHLGKECISVESAVMQKDYKLAYDELLQKDIESFNLDLKFIYFNRLLDAAACVVSDAPNYDVVKRAIGHAVTYNKLLHQNEFYKANGAFHIKYIDLFRHALGQFIRAFERGFLKFAGEFSEDAVTELSTTMFDLAKQNDVPTNYLSFNLGIFYGNQYTGKLNASYLGRFSNAVSRSVTMPRRLKDIALKHFSVAIQGDMLSIKIKAYFAMGYIYELEEKYKLAIACLLKGLSLFERFEEAGIKSFEKDEQPEAKAALSDCMKKSYLSGDTSDVEAKIKWFQERVHQCEDGGKFQQAIDFCQQLSLFIAFAPGGLLKRFAPYHCRKKKKKTWLKKNTQSKIVALMKRVAQESDVDEQKDALFSDDSPALQEARKILSRFTEVLPSCSTKSNVSDDAILLPGSSEIPIINNRSAFFIVDESCKQAPSLAELNSRLEALKTDNPSQALRRAAYKGLLEDVKYFSGIVHNINAQDVNPAKQYTALHLAVKKGRSSVIEYLLSADASPEVLDAQGKRPIDYAKSDDIKRLFFPKAPVLS